MKIFDNDHFSSNEENKHPTQTQPTQSNSNNAQSTNSTDTPKDNFLDANKENPTTSPTKEIEPIDLTIFTKTDEIIKPVNKVYFKVADKASKSIIDIDNTAFTPSKITLLARPFSNAYYNQLVSEVLMNRKKHEEINLHFIMHALVFYEKIKENKYPIYIRCVKYPRLTRDIVQMLNKVFNEYMPVFEGIYQMFSSKVE